MTSLLKKIVPALVTSLLCAGLCAQQVEYKDVEANGAGPTESFAIQDGLRQCIAQVYGMSIAADTRLEIVEATLSVKGVGTTKSREKLNNRIETATKGRVASYSVISPAQQTKLGTEIRIAAKIAKYKSGAQDTRLRLAFPPLRAARDYYVCDDENISGPAVSAQLIHALSQKITSSRKFLVLDREYTDEIAAEQQTISNSASSDDQCKLGVILGADYIIAGTIENFNVQSENVKAGSISVERKIGSAAVALRVLDVATGQLKFSQTINTKLPIKRNASSASMDLAEQVASAAAAKILEAIYPVRAIAFENGELVLNQGSDMIKVGDKYELFALGDMLKDPGNSESIERRETKCGVIEIIRSKPKTSDAKVLESNADLSALIETKSLLCRPLKQAAQPAPTFKDQLKNEW